jgi:hypothetical protein
LFNKFKFVDWDNDDYIDIELHWDLKQTSHQGIWLNFNSLQRINFKDWDEHFNEIENRFQWHLWDPSNWITWLRLSWSQLWIVVELQTMVDFFKSSTGSGSLRLT